MKLSYEKISLLEQGLHLLNRSVKDLMVDTGGEAKEEGEKVLERIHALKIELCEESEKLDAAAENHEVKHT